MGLILHYFTEFVYDIVVKRLRSLSHLLMTLVVVTGPDVQLRCCDQGAVTATPNRHSCSIGAFNEHEWNTLEWK